MYRVIYFSQFRERVKEFLSNHDIFWLQEFNVRSQERMILRHVNHSSMSKDSVDFFGTLVANNALDWLPTVMSPRLDPIHFRGFLVHSIF